MCRDAFGSLCSLVSKEVGSREFYSEYDTSDNIGYREKKMRGAHTAGSGGFLSGEIKMAMFIQLLSSGSYLDIGGCWGVFPTTIFKVFDQVLGWLSVMPFGMIDIGRYLSSDDCPESRLR